MAEFQQMSRIRSANRYGAAGMAIMLESFEMTGIDKKTYTEDMFW